MSVSNYLIGAVPQEFQDYFRQTKWGSDWFTNTEIQIVEEPQHGELEHSSSNLVDLVYYPDKGYLGKDHVVVLATNTLPDGRPVRAKLIFFLNVIPIADIPLGGSGQYIKSNTSYCPTGKEDWRISAAPDGKGGSYSQYQGLPTSNPNEWVAKIGSPAYGKMDMYTVLLHEYGYALGLDHSSHSQVPPEADLANSISAFHY